MGFELPNRITMQLRTGTWCCFAHRIIETPCGLCSADIGCPRVATTPALGIIELQSRPSMSTKERLRDTSPNTLQKTSTVFK